MRLVQRISALLAWLAMLATGLLLVGEGTGIAGGGWRQAVGDLATSIDRANLAHWAAALLGVLIGLVALAVLAAQFVPVQLTGRSSVVDRSAAGSTLVNAAAVRRAVSQRLGELPGVVTASPVAHRRRLTMRVELGQGVDAKAVTSAGRQQLNDEFWNSLGTEAIPVDIHLNYIPGAAQPEQETV
ncbi:MAG: hypothetical protein OEM81_13670 [Acidimicrobiia bacterium]|nr:hypothetical protein [Acidimicrobiia bacterium]MDH3398860.1 hypothetical protein [Acidimicrobiia bacterium]MDH5615009.1 hypothetical protein [Acidimicrobiia bacterium]